MGGAGGGGGAVGGGRGGGGRGGAFSYVRYNIAPSQAPIVSHVESDEPKVYSLHLELSPGTAFTASCHR